MQAYNIFISSLHAHRLECVTQAFPKSNAFLRYENLTSSGEGMDSVGEIELDDLFYRIGQHSFRIRATHVDEKDHKIAGAV